MLQLYVRFITVLRDDANHNGIILCFRGMDLTEVLRARNEPPPRPIWHSSSSPLLGSSSTNLSPPVRRRRRRETLDRRERA